MLRIRQMIPSDLIDVRPLYHDMIEELKKDPNYVNYPVMFEEDYETFTRSIFQILRAQIEQGAFPDFRALVCVHGSHPKGFVFGRLAPRPWAQPAIFLVGEILYVDPQFRGQGNANSLISNLCEWGKSLGAGAYELWAIPGSKAHKQWHEAGFKGYSVSMVFADKNMKPIVDQAPRLEFKPVEQPVEKVEKKEAS
jgi:GNAT superfamily N-acetyltransferase